MNRPRNVLLQNSDPRESVSLEFQHSVGALRHHLEIHQTPIDATWPGGALWDCGVLLSQLLLGVAGVEDVTLRSTFLAEDNTDHIVMNSSGNGGTTTTNNGSGSSKTKNKQSKLKLEKPKNSHQKQKQSRTTTQIATRLRNWIQNPKLASITNNSHKHNLQQIIWNERVEEILLHTPQLRVLELGCGVGLTGLIAAVALGAVTTILTDLTEVVDGITLQNVEQNSDPLNSSAVSSKKKKGSSHQAATIRNNIPILEQYPCRSIRHFKGGGKVVGMPLCWGDQQEGEQVLQVFEALQPPPLSASTSTANSRGNKGKGKSKGNTKQSSTTTNKTAGGGSSTSLPESSYYYPHLILLGDVAYQHKPGAPSHFDILLETLQQFMPPTTQRTREASAKSSIDNNNNDDGATTPTPPESNNNSKSAVTPTLLLFGTRLRMPASMDLLLLLEEHFERLLPEPIPAQILDPALQGVKHNMAIHVFTNK